MRRTLQICFFFAVAIFSTFTKLNAAAAEHKVSPRTAYTAVYEVKGLGQSSMLTEYSDGARFVRQENSSQQDKFTLVDYLNGEVLYCSGNSFTRMPSRIINYRSISVANRTSIGGFALGEKKIGAWNCKGYRMVAPYSSSDVWIDKNSGLTISSKSNSPGNASEMHLTRLELKKPPASLFSFPSKEKKWTEPKNSKLPTWFDKTRLPAVGKQKDGSIISISISASSVTINTRSPDGGRRIHIFSKDSEREMRIDANDNLYYNWDDSHSGCALTLAHIGRPITFDRCASNKRTIRTTLRDGTVEEQVFDDRGWRKSVQDPTGKTIKEIGTCDQFVAPTIKTDKSFVALTNISISDLPISQIKQDDGSTRLCLTLGAGNAIAITSKENKIKQIEGCFGNDNTIVLENFDSLKPSLRKRNGISKAFALMPLLVEASSASTPEPPPLPKLPRFYKPVSYKPLTGKPMKLMINGLGISCESPDAKRREVSISFPGGEKVNVSAINRQISQVTCISRGNGVILKRGSNHEIEQVPFKE